MLNIYKFLMLFSTIPLELALKIRQNAGKEPLERISERKGHPSQPRPEGPLIWVHAASVGEAQSALVLIRNLLNNHPAWAVMITTGTLTSAQMLEKTLPDRAFHQFFPLDHPKWVARFLDHWRPDVCLWMESELWPNMLMEINARNIPAALVNARLSERSFRNWKQLGDTAARLLRAFSVILAQTPDDQARFRSLGGVHVMMTDNLKYSAAPLPFDTKDLAALQNATAGRPLWLYASTHKGEEALACRVHKVLSQVLPDILTIVVPRHPARRDEIVSTCTAAGLPHVLRGENKQLPDSHTAVYIADTMGELGLFYTLSPLALIGRSFSDDGGGGHNPIEPAQLGCAVLYGPHVQFQQALYGAMKAEGAAFQVFDQETLTKTVLNLLKDKDALKECRKKAQDFAALRAEAALKNVLQQIAPLLPADPAKTGAAA